MKQVISILEKIFNEKIQGITKIDFDNFGSISNQVSLQKPSIYKYKIEFKEIEKVVICKYKSRKIIENGINFLNYDGDLNFYKLLKNQHKILSFDHSQIREIMIYKNIDKSLKKHLIPVYGSYSSDEEDLYLICMDEITHNEEIDFKWIIKILDSITDFHAFYYNDETSVEELLLNQYSSLDYKYSKDLLNEMQNKIKGENFSEKNYNSMIKFIENIDILHEKLPNHKTLTHNDFSPRNIFCTNNKVYIYDWELSAFQNPEHDLVEFLVAVMTNMIDEEIMQIIKYFKETLFYKISLSFTEDEYRKILKFNILEFAVNKLSVFRLANVHLKYDFIDQMAENTNRLMDLVGV